MSDRIPQPIQVLITQLAAGNAATREHARAALVAIGTSEVTRALVLELNDPRSFVRYEAAKALCAIADPSAAAALVFHLDDDNSSVRWLAAEALARLGEAGLYATLTGAIRLARSTQYCRAAHHVFHECLKQGIQRLDLAKLMHACEGPEPALSLPVASFRALFQLETGSSPAVC